MYKLHLIRKYLLKRRIAWVALVAVTLCTAMVLVVVSVMGGWLRNFEDSFHHGMTGDVVISGTSLGGFPYYQEMIDGIQKVPDVQSAAPIIRTFGLLNYAGAVNVVHVWGYPPNIGLVNDWPATLHLNAEDRKRELEAAARRPLISDEQKNWIGDQIKQLPFSLHMDVAYENYLDSRARANALQRAPIIVSSAIPPIPRKDEEEADNVRYNLYRSPASLSLVPITAGEAISADTVRSVPAWIVDDSKSQIFALDNDAVYLSFDELQKDLQMAASDAKPATADQPAIDASPARCSEVEIKAKPGVDLIALRKEVFDVTETVRAKHRDDWGYGYRVQTWEESQGIFIKAVKNEVVLTTALFGIISMVAVLLIFCIFYMIVVEKTKDIGIIKSVGATGGGILSLFLGYGFAIGVIGAGLGFGTAYYVVKYINEIHAWLGRRMGIVIWSAETYQFDKIPNRMETSTVVYVLIIAVLSAVFGALIPAIRAAGMNPVDALKYEQEFTMSQLAVQEMSAGVQEQEVILRVEGIRKSFRIGDTEVQILKGTDFSLKAGEFVAIEGRSGSGKSTLLHILGALESLDDGSTTFDSTEYSMRSPREQRWWNPLSWALGVWMRIEFVLAVFAAAATVAGWFYRDSYVSMKELLAVGGLTLALIALLIGSAVLYEKREKPRATIRNRKFGFVFQFYHLLPELNAVQNTMLAVMIERSPFGFMKKRAEIQKRATDLLTELGLAHRLKHRSSHLSGGERQRVAIARALMNSPKILFADEPTGNLDAETGRQIMDVLEKLHREHGQTIVMVTHDRSLAREADRVLVLKDGKLEPAV